MTDREPSPEERAQKLDDDWEISYEVGHPEDMMADLVATIRAAEDAQREKDASVDFWSVQCPDCGTGIGHPCVLYKANGKPIITDMIHTERAIRAAAIRAQGESEDD